MKFILSVLVLLVSVSAHAELSFIKSNDGTVVLTIKEETGKATIKQSNQLLYQGDVRQETDDEVTLVLKEGDSCPNIQIQYMTDADKGEKHAALVRVKTEEGGSILNGKDCPIAGVNGEYYRE